MRSLSACLSRTSALGWCEVEPRDWVPLALGVLSFLGLWVGQKFAARGKAADQKMLERQQSYTELSELAETRLEEIKRKDLHISALEGRNDNLWRSHRRLIDLYYRWRKDGAPDPEPMPSDH